MENSGQLKSFRDLKVWQKAADLASLVYMVTEKFPNSELYGITNQMRRSAVSVSSNIAEGFKRNHKKEKLQFYNVAYGSVAELESQVEIAFRLNFLNQEEYQKLNLFVIEIGKMIDGLIKSTNKTSPKSYVLNSISLIIILYSIFYILYPCHVLAAQIYFESPLGNEIALSQTFEVALVVNTEGEHLNAFEGIVAYPNDILEAQEIVDGNSAVNLWIEKPHARDRADGEKEIFFSGITPGGFWGDSGHLFSVRFYAQREGSGAIAARDLRVLLNDGEGTPARVVASPLELAVGTATAHVPITFRRDNDAPEPFEIYLAQDPNIFEGKWFVSFAAQDKLSGIDRYEVKEGDMPFVVAHSPYVLRRQNLDVAVVVRAADKYGNERIVILPPSNVVPIYEKLVKLFIIVLGASIVIFFVRRRQKSSS